MKQGFITTRDGVRIAYAENGAGTPYLWVRAWISHLGIMWQDRNFNAFFSRLGHHFRVYRYDMRGNGLSERNVGYPSMTDLVDELEDVVDELGLDDLVLHATSFGGPIAMEYANRQPSKLRALVLDGTYAHGEALGNRERRVMLVRALNDFPEMGFLYLAHATSPGPYRAAYRRPEVLRQMIKPDMASKLYELGFEFDVRDTIGDIVSPTLVLHRKESRSISFDLGRDLATKIPGAKFFELSGSEQNIWEGDANEPLEAIEDFLAVHENESPAEHPISIFVSYSRADAPPVREDISHLEAHGIGAWLDEGNIAPGTVWREEISAAIENSDVFVAFVSPAYLDSESCRQEITFALEESRPIIVVYLEPTATPGWFRLSLSDRQSIWRYQTSLSEYWESFAKGIRLLAGSQ